MDGEAHGLDDYFTVFATQNPLEFEGTYPLPEAQLDRFLIKIKVGLLSIAGRRAHDSGTASCERRSERPRAGCDSASPVLAVSCRAEEIRAVKVEPAIFNYLLAVVRRTREWPTVSLGASPRASASLLIVSKAYAAKDRPRLSDSR